MDDDDDDDDDGDDGGDDDGGGDDDDDDDDESLPHFRMPKSSFFSIRCNSKSVSKLKSISADILLSSSSKK